jgi:DNA-binding transcriptional MerR regulator
VKQYVLRYWESEFDVLHPKKSKNGQRMYTKKDVETALMIRKLLYDDRFSIEGAQAAIKKLRQQVKEKEKEKEKPTVQSSEPQKTDMDFAESLLEQIRQAKLNLNL